MDVHVDASGIHSETFELSNTCRDDIDVQRLLVASHP